MSTLSTKRKPWRLSPRADRFARWLIVGVGLLCFVLLAWDHLGFGALIVPPAPSAPQQVASLDGGQAVLALTSGQLTANGANTVTLTLRNATGRPAPDATVLAQLVMTSMPMQAPTVPATRVANGQYLAHPRFSMAGVWRLSFVVTWPEQAAQAVNFVVSVRWS